MADHQRHDRDARELSGIDVVHPAPRRVHGIEVQRNRSDDRGGVERHELERGWSEWSVGADPIAGDQREPDAEQQVDQRNDRNDGPPDDNVTRRAAAAGNRRPRPGQRRSIGGVRDPVSGSDGSG